MYGALSPGECSPMATALTCVPSSSFSMSPSPLTPTIVLRFFLVCVVHAGPMPT